MQRLIGAFVVAASASLILATSACDNAQPTTRNTPRPPSLSVLPSSTSPSSIPVPLEIPDSAKSHTRYGAIKFTAYYWKAVSYAEKSLDTSILRPLDDGHCAGCSDTIASIEEIAAQKGEIRGGVFSVLNPRATNFFAGGQQWVSISFTVTASPEIIHYPEGSKDQQYAGGRRTGRMVLRPVRTGWKIDLLELSS
jgi:hypothetical protein